MPDKKTKKNIKNIVSSGKRVSFGKKKSSVKNIPPKNMFNNVFFYIFLLIIGYLIFGLVFSGGGPLEERPLNEVVNLIREEKVQDVTVTGDNIEVLLKDGTKFVTEKESGVSFTEILADNNTDISKIAGEYKVKHPMGWEQVISPLLMF